MGAAGFSRSFTQIFPSSPTYCGRGIAEEVPLMPCRRHSPMDCHRQKNPVLSDEALMLLLPFSWVGQVLSLRLTRCLWHLAAKKAPSFRTRLLCWHYLSSRAGQVLSLRSTRCLWHLAARKSPVLSDEALMLALPIFPGSHPPSIVGVHELNFCVRDGNRWTLMTINTNFCGWLLTIVMSNDFRHLTA